MNKINPLNPLLLLAFLCLSVSAHQTVEEWDKDAGLIYSYTENCDITASSNIKALTQVVDGNRETAWQSEAPLPDGYVPRKDLNSFLKEQVSISASKVKGKEAAIDGDLSSPANVDVSWGSAYIELNFAEAQHLDLISIKIGTSTEVKVEAINGTTVFNGTLGKAENYKLTRFDIGKKVKSIKLSAKAGFQLFEIGGLAGLPTEWVQFDFGAPKRIGTINCRYWPGHGAAKAVKVLLSNDKKEWKEVANLNPEGLQSLMVNVSPVVNAQYLKIYYELDPKEWNKIYLWEVAAYDEYGMFGPMPKAQASNVTVEELLGVNGIWGWGTNQYSEDIPAGQGTLLYKPVANHARNYHDMKWDVKDPDNAPDYVKMAAGKGTEMQWWLNWDKEYRHWVKTGFNVQATVQIHNFNETEWNKPFESGLEYGSRFAKHFGVSNGNGLICTFEAGNEPWKYSADVYKDILYGMAKGVKSVDPVMEVFPCALQAADPSMENTDIFKNYMGARLTEREAAFLDGINIHCYSYIMNPDGNRSAVHPEHPNTSFREMLNAIRFRDKNMPGKKIYLSEWGWDNTGGGEACTHDVCVSEDAGAVYAVRAALMVQRLGIDRATWYFYANVDKTSSLYSRSGYTSTNMTGFRKKKVYYAVESLIERCGPAYFLKTLKEDDDAWVYLLGDKEGKPTHIAAWRPVDVEDNTTMQIPIKGKFQAAKAYRIDGNEEGGTPIPVPPYENGAMILEPGPAPILIQLK